MSDDAIETFPRDNGVISAGRIVTQFFDGSSSGQIEKDPTTYSISGQSGGNSARAARAAELRLRRLSAGSFSHPVYDVSLGIRERGGDTHRDSQCSDWPRYQSRWQDTQSRTRQQYLDLGE